MFDQQRAGVLRAVADDRDLDAALAEPAQERDRVVEQARVREQEILVLAHQLGHQAGAGLLAGRPQDLGERIGFRDPAVGYLGPDPGVLDLPGIGGDAGQGRQLVPQDREIAGHNRVVGVNEASFETGHTTSLRDADGGETITLVRRQALRQRERPEVRADLLRARRAEQDRGHRGIQQRERHR
jgi:hypothetical protein